MKNHNPSGKSLQFAETRQRVLAGFLFAVIAALIWLAYSGRYDAEVNRLAGWLRGHYDALVR
ncbi:hypothetical protein [Lysobacter niastensis]|uniref:Uncharacterized protein n=1 Tax=Lysobacter niastensis TaxID=380629 RepID=A0ABS0B9H1_9GAMM|nr:hypothetical protein [Lysobacter niastensis]MBF6023760.1 hypothetical protein [Lysobacter niastensis]